MTPLRIVVIDDSLVCREELTSILEADGDISVVASASNGEEALEVVRRVAPDLATVDLSMPGMDGIALVERLMAEHPLPLLVVTAAADGAGAFEAVRRGALDIAPKPDGRDPRAIAELRRRVRSLAKLPVVRHVAGRRPSLPLTETGAARVFAIGCSAGGPAALAAILAKLPAEFPCVPIVQHLPPAFADSFAAFLREHTRMRVDVVRKRAEPAPGRVLIAPDERHLVAVAGGMFEAADGPPENGFRPSIDVLFRSVAAAFGRAATGVVLTGIGSDGAKGLLELRRTGALTIAQDEAGCAVFGIPKAAQACGAAVESIPLDRMASRLLRAAGIPERGAA